MRLIARSVLEPSHPVVQLLPPRTNHLVVRPHLPPRQSTNFWQSTSLRLSSLFRVLPQLTNNECAVPRSFLATPTSSHPPRSEEAVLTMTTNFPRTDNYTTLLSSQINLYGAQQISPINSASATPMNVSPTSPRNPSQLAHLPLHTRQLRPPKSPLYVPAVLRPTERPTKQTPLTPPRSVHGSLDSLDGVEAGRMLSRHSMGESMNKTGTSRLVEGERRGDSGVGTVTGLPTREHWKVSIQLRCHAFFVAQTSFTSLIGLYYLSYFLPSAMPSTVHGWKIFKVSSSLPSACASRLH